MTGKVQVEDNHGTHATLLFFNYTIFAPKAQGENQMALVKMNPVTSIFLSAAQTLMPKGG